MKFYLRAPFVFSAIVLLAGCASTPDPAVVCTSEWIAPRADSAIKRIEKRASSSIKALTAASIDRAQGKTPGLMQMISLTFAVKKLEAELKHGQGIRDLKIVAKTCNNPAVIEDSMRTLLKRQGVSDDFMQQLEGNPIYQSVISSLTAPQPVTVNR